MFRSFLVTPKKSEKTHSNFKHQRHFPIRTMQRSCMSAAVEVAVDLQWTLGSEPQGPLGASCQAGSGKCWGKWLGNSG